MKKTTILCIAILLSLCMLRCSAPDNPFDNTENAYATFKSINNAFPLNINDVHQAETVTIVYTMHFPDLIDSVSLKILSAQQTTEARYLFRPPWKTNNEYTVDIVFPNSGTKTCHLTCYKIDGTSSEVLLTFSVAPKTIINQNVAPKWAPDTIEMTTIKGTAESLNLMPYANDPEKKAVSFSVLLPNSLFTSHDSIIISTAALDTGSYPIRVIISDGSLFDTGTVIWKVAQPQTGHITIKNDSVLTVSDSQITINVLANDSIDSGILLLSSTTQPFHGIVALKDNKVIYIPSKDFAGTDSFNYVVNNKATGSVFVTVTRSVLSDITPPLLELISPQTDSTTVNSPNATVSITATDKSGILSVKAWFGSTLLQTAAAAPLYTVSVSGLSAGKNNTIMIIATDASLAGNKDTLFVTLKYDPAAADETGPVFKQISGPVSGTVVTNPLISIVDSITDPSGIDSVFFSTNGAHLKLLTLVSGKTNQFQLTDTLARERLDTIIVTAVDKSPKHNRNVQIFIFDFVKPIVISKQPQNQTVCPNSPAVFSITVNGTAPFTYQWRRGSANNITDIAGATGASYTFTATSSDNAAIFSCAVKSISGQITLSESATLTVNAGPNKPVAAAVPASICAGGSSVLSVSSGSAGDGASWQWYTAKGSTTPLLSTTVTPATGRWYFVKSSGSPCGDSDWDSVFVSVNSQSTAPSGITSSSDAICSGSQVVLTQTGGILGSGAMWQWFTDAECTQPAPGTPNADGSQFTTSPVSTTTYFVKGIGKCNSTTTVSKTITVNMPSTAPNSIAAATSSVCPGSSISLSVVGGFLGTNAVWKWYTNTECTLAAAGISNADGSQFAASPSTMTTYFVRAEGACGSTSAANRTISINTPPSFTATLSGQDLCEQGGNYQNGYYSISATGAGPISYVWYDIEGNILGRGSQVGVQTKNASSTQFYCIATDVNGCSTKSNIAKQVVHAATKVTQQPTPRAGYQGYTFADSIAATADGSLTYQWLYQLPNGNWELIATGQNVTIETFSAFTGYSSYWGTEQTIQIPVKVKITNAFGCETFSDEVAYSIMCGI